MSADPWSISAEDFPANGTTAEKWKFFLRYAVLAPSSHNFFRDYSFLFG